MELRVVVRVEDGEQDQAARARDGEKDGEEREKFLGEGGVWGERAFVTEPSFTDEAQVEEDGGDDGAADEEWFEIVGAYVGNVGYCLSVLH